MTMNTYETSATVKEQGRVQIDGVPFAAGTQVEVSISPKRRPAGEFAAAWRRLCAELRARLPNISDEDIQAEIDRYRTVQRRC